MKEKLAEWLIVLQGYRKFLMCFIALAVSTIFRTKSLVSGGEWSDLAKAVVISFCGTNGLEGITAVLKEHLAARREAGSVLQTPKDKPEDEDVEIESTESAK